AAPADGPPVEDLQSRLDAARTEYAQRERAWRPTMRASSERVVAADREIGRLTALISQAERRSPIEGVVTAVYANEGAAVEASQPVLRIDRPEGYRIVTMVDRNVRRGLAPG